MLWLLLAVLLIAVFGIGTVFEAAFWVLLVIAAIAVVVTVLISGALGRGPRRGA